LTALDLVELTGSARDLVNAGARIAEMEVFP
jgi:hypothetical protein